MKKILEEILLGLILAASIIIFVGGIVLIPTYLFKGSPQNTIQNKITYNVEEQTFTRIQNDVIIHDQTGVMYYYNKNNILTPLVGTDGTPLIYKQSSDNNEEKEEGGKEKNNEN